MSSISSCNLFSNKGICAWHVYKLKNSDNDYSVDYSNVE